MPNCDCAPKCRAFEERVWSGNFMCRTIGENATDPEDTTQDRERVTQVTESNEPSSGHTVQQTNKQVDIGIKSKDKELSVVDKRQNTGNQESNHSVMIIGLVTIGIILAVAVVIFVLVFVLKHRHIDWGYRSVQSAAENPGDTNKNTKEKESSQVNKISNTKVRKTTYHFHTNNATVNFNREHQGTRNLEIQNASESIDTETCLKSANKPSLLPPQMQNLKELEMPQPDSGIQTIDQTYEKKHSNYVIHKQLCVDMSVEERKICYGLSNSHCVSLLERQCFIRRN